MSSAIIDTAMKAIIIASARAESGVKRKKLESGR
jgi:hypothetical protein